MVGLAVARYGGKDPDAWSPPLGRHLEVFKYADDLGRGPHDVLAVDRVPCFCSRVLCVAGDGVGFVVGPAELEAMRQGRGPHAVWSWLLPVQCLPPEHDVTYCLVS